MIQEVTAPVEEDLGLTVKETNKERKKKKKQIELTTQPEVSKDLDHQVNARYKELFPSAAGYDGAITREALEDRGKIEEYQVGVPKEPAQPPPTTVGHSFSFGFGVKERKVEQASSFTFGFGSGGFGDTSAGPEKEQESRDAGPDVKTLTQTQSLI